MQQSLYHYLSNFWQSLEMSLINCKVQINLKLTKHCALATDGNDNGDANSNNIIFTTKDTTQTVPIVTLSAKDVQKLLKLLSKESERSAYWNEYKTKNANKNTTNEYRYFFKSDFVGVNRLLILVYSDNENASKRYSAFKYSLLKSIIDNSNIIINGKNFYDQTIDSDIK